MTYPSSHGPNASQLSELKLISAGATWYHAREKSVDIRARQLPRLYKEKAKRVDNLYRGTEEDQIGPVQQKLEGFGDLACLVIGQFAEGSQHLHNFLLRCSELKARRIHQMTGEFPTDYDRSQILQQMRRWLSV